MRLIEGGLYLLVLCSVWSCSQTDISRHDSAPTWVGTVDLVIGDPASADDHTIFNDIRGITLDSSGRLLVSDEQTSDVRVFLPDGRYAFSLGRRGKGPGDLQGPCCISLDSRGHLWVQEPGNQRYSVFALHDSAGEYLYSVRMPGQGSSQSDRVTWDPAGRIVYVAGSFSPATMRFGLVRSLLDSAGNESARDTLPEPPSDSVGFAVITGPNGGATGVNQPYGAVLLRAFGANGEHATAVSSRYAVNWLDANGQRVRLFEREVEGPAVSGKERKDAEAILERLARNLHVDRSTMPFGVPDHKAPLRSLGFDLDGRLWVELSVPADSSRMADVYARNGQWLATAVWPANIRLHHWAVQGTTGFGILTDSLGNQMIARLNFAS